MSRTVLLLFSCSWLFFGTMAAAKQPTSPQIPFFFVENRGQTDPRVRAVGTGTGFKAWFDDDGVLLQQGEATVRVHFPGATPKPAIALAEPLGATANYLRGNNPAHWQTKLPMFGALKYSAVWPGVDITYRQDGAGVKVEYTVAPGSDIRNIRLDFEGDVNINVDGSLTVRNRTGVFREAKPILYQDTPAGRNTFSGSFVKSGDGLVTFNAEYDHSRALVIDPTIQFSGYFGGTGQDNITAVAVTSAFRTIAAGWTNSYDLPATAGARTASGGSVDAFVAGFSPVGGQLVFCTYLGGSGDDRAFGVAVDSSSNIYVTGWSSSGNFPVVGGVQAHINGARDAFVTKLNAAGSAIVYSTYLGGSAVDVGNAIAVDSAGQAVIVGDTTSVNLPTTTGAYQRTLAGGQDAFVARLAASGAGLSFATYFGGNSTDHGAAIQIDPAGPIVIGGGTNSVNLPVLLAFQSRSGGGQDGFVTKLNAAGTALVTSTYLGGSGGSPGFPEQVTSLVIGPSKNIVAAGITSSPNFPVTLASLQPNYGGGQTDGFMTKLNATTGALMVSTYFGGSNNDGINGIAGDQLGRVYVTGFTLSTDFPVKNASQSLSAGGIPGSMEAFVSSLPSAMNSLAFSTYLGGSGSDAGNAIAVDALTSIVVAGQTGSFDFPAVGSLGAFPSANLSSFITKYAPDWTLSVATGQTLTVDTYHVAGLNGATTTFTYGQAGDIPIAGDWTGSGVKRTGVFRNGVWILDTNGDGVLNAGDLVVSFGQAGDVPVLGDWNGTGKIKLGLYRAGTFILDLSGHISGVPTGVQDATFAFGLSTDIPVVGDWNANGTAKVGVFRNGSWLIDYNGDRLLNTLDKTYTYGTTGDIPVTGNWDSAGLTRIGVYRSGNWILNFAGTNVLGTLGQTELYIPFGAAGQTPIVR